MGSSPKSKLAEIEGIEADLLLETFQIHHENTSCSPEEFCRRFPVGMRLDVVTTTEITPELDLENPGESATATDNLQHRLQ